MNQYHQKVLFIVLQTQHETAEKLVRQDKHHILIKIKICLISDSIQLKLIRDHSNVHSRTIIKQLTFLIMSYFMKIWMHWQHSDEISKRFANQMMMRIIIIMLYWVLRKRLQMSKNIFWMMRRHWNFECFRHLKLILLILHAEVLVFVMNNSDKFSLSWFNLIMIDWISM